MSPEPALPALVTAILLLCLLATLGLLILLFLELWSARPGSKRRTAEQREIAQLEAALADELRQFIREVEATHPPEKVN